jgi:mannose-6-phosphate isomerase-like protein (cupin superfamily)
VRRLVPASVVAAVAAIAIAVALLVSGEPTHAQSQGGAPTAKSLDCPAAKRRQILREEQESIHARLGPLTTLNGPRDLKLLADQGFSLRPNQFTSIEGIGVTVENPVPLIQQGSPNLLFYAPSPGASRTTDPRTPDFPYTLAGWGYGLPFAPYHLPGFLPCVGAKDWHVHERGVDDAHTGRTVVMPPSETSIGAGIGVVSDPPALGAVEGIPHARAWEVHLWDGPSGVPRSAILDPTAPAPGVKADVGSNFYFLDDPPTGVLDPSATGAPIALDAEEGQHLKAGGGAYTFKGTSFNRGGNLNLVTATLPAGSKRADSGTLGHDEGWYLISGEMTFHAGGQTLPARQGSFVYLPAGVDYDFEVPDGTARAVYVAVTAGQQRQASLKPFVLEPGEGERLTVGGSPYYLKATAADTGGAFSFMEVNIKSGGEPPPHIHHKEIELFYLVDGEMSFVTGGQTIPAESGGMVQLPLGMPHYYRVQGDGTAKALLIALPGGLEDLFRTLDKLGDKPPTAAQALKTGVEPAFPPGG